MIRLAKYQDLPTILEIYEYARQFMRAQGNPSQWGATHPEEDILAADIDNNVLYLIEQGDQIQGVFAFIIGEDSTYDIIDHGQWKSNDTYGTIHRVAAAEGTTGIVKKAVEYCKTLHPYIRIDTHEKNLVMQHLIQKTGFEKSGIIYAYDGSPRIAYELLP
jgi:hypothetical protein